MFKRCTRCNAEKPLSDFYFTKTTNRHNPCCKRCINEKERGRWKEGTSSLWAKRYSTNSGRAVNLLNNARTRAKTKGIPFSLDAEWIEEQLDTGKCAVTGIPFDMGAGAGSGQGRAFGPSLDRIDPSLGYTQDNTQVVCWLYNRAKGVQGHGEVMKMVEALCPKS